MATRFVELSALQGPQGPPGPRGPRGPRGRKGPKPTVKCRLVNHRHKIKCKVTFPKHHRAKGKLQVRILRGTHLAALGHARISHGSATLSMRELRHVTHGAWSATVVLAQPHRAPTTSRSRIRIT